MGNLKVQESTKRARYVKMYNILKVQYLIHDLMDETNSCLGSVSLIVFIKI